MKWGVRGAVVLVLALAAWGWNHEHRQLLDERQGRASAEARLNNQIAANQDSKATLEEKIKELSSTSAALAGVLAEQRRAQPNAKTVFVADLRTKSVAVADVPRVPDPPPGDAPVPLPPCPGGTYAPDGMGGFYCQEAGTAGKVEHARCVLSSDDRASFRVREVGLRGAAGNSTLAGVAEFWRDLPPPSIKLSEGPFSATLSDLDVLKQPPVKRWGFELGGSLGSVGEALGVGLLFPPVSVLGLRLEPRVNALSPPAWSVQGWLGVRL